MTTIGRQSSKHIKTCPKFLCHFHVARWGLLQLSGSIWSNNAIVVLHTQVLAANSHFSKFQFTFLLLLQKYHQFPYPWATLTDGGPPSFPGAWPAQLCDQGSNSLPPKQVAHRLHKCFGLPLSIFTRPTLALKWLDLCSEHSLDTYLHPWLSLQVG